MERYTVDLRLPQIVQLMPALPQNREDYDLDCRAIYLHTPTCCIVEVIPEERVFDGKKRIELPFDEKVPNGEIYKYTAVLLNKPKQVSDEDSMKAMKAVARWYKKERSDFDFFNSLEWVDAPECSLLQ